MHMVWRKFSGEIISIPIAEHVKKCIEEETAKNNKLKVINAFFIRSVFKRLIN